MTIYDLSGDWEFGTEAWLRPGAKYGLSKLGWLPATVPGHVHLDLVAHSILGSPTERQFELGAEWVDERPWSYRTTVKVESRHAHQRLRFEGLDTLATIRIDGAVVARSENMFLPVEVDVTGRQAFELRVDFESAEAEGARRRADYLAAEGLGDIDLLEHRAFLRKAQFMFGWDWGPRIVSCGIWQPVRFLDFDSRLTDVHARQIWRGPEVRLEVRSEQEGEGLPLHRLLDPSGLVMGEVLGDGAIDVAKPSLWWDHRRGDQPLYMLESKLGDHTVRQRIGLRRIELLREPDEFGESFEFALNGERIWAMGANWIPHSSLGFAGDPDRYRTLLESAKAMEMNMLRVWGGGIYETETFYDLCDELGILVWQDFPFACSYYPDGESMQAQVREEAEFQVRRLRNRASLALWCGNNENQQLHFDGWADAARRPERFLGERLYDEVLPEVVGRLDPDRAYIPGSPIGGEKPNMDDFGDQHFWGVWHGSLDWKAYETSRARFSSEYGFASAAGLNGWLEQGIVDLESPALWWHNKTGKSRATFEEAVGLFYPAAKNLEEWIFVSQLNQRDALRCAIEHYRTSDFCRGSLIWQLNDCWHTMSWALVDGSLQPKLAACELRRLYAADLLVLRVEDGRASARWASDRRTPAPSQWSWEVWDVVDSVTVGSGSSPFGESIDLPGFDPRRSACVIRAGGLEAWRFFARPKEMIWPDAAPIQVSLDREASVLASEQLLIDVALEGPGLDRLVTLAPGVPVRVHGQVRGARSLLGSHPLTAR